MSRLPCDNIEDFMNGINHYYTVYDGDYEKGDIVTLVWEDIEEDFEVMVVSKVGNRTALGLMNLDDSKKVKSFYAGYNLND